MVYWIYCLHFLSLLFLFCFVFKYTTICSVRIFFLLGQTLQPSHQPKDGAVGRELWCRPTALRRFSCRRGCPTGLVCFPAPHSLPHVFCFCFAFMLILYCFALIRDTGKPRVFHCFVVAPSSSAFLSFPADDQRVKKQNKERNKNWNKKQTRIESENGRKIWNKNKEGPI